MPARPVHLVVAASMLLVFGCTGSGPDGVAARTLPPAASTASTQPATPETKDAVGAGTSTAPSAPTSNSTTRPDWLATRILPLASDGFGERLPTPDELSDRQLATPFLPAPVPSAPPVDGSFRSTVSAVPLDVLARSTWTSACPVTADELRYVTVTFVGFDGLAHTGELLVHASIVDDVVAIFGALHAAAFPLEEVRVIALEELDVPPTGDGNVTSAFVCRPTVGGTRWSEHAFGRAIDINPFHNPYVRGDLVLPELASAYVDRERRRPGMIADGDSVTAAFAARGWRWGGQWTGRAVDWMHFSPSGR